jgi:hypothetical protein
MTPPLRSQDLARHRHDEEVAKLRFPDAPEGSWVSDEGWLVIGDEAFTEEGWNGNEGREYRAARNPAAGRRRSRRWREAHPEEHRRRERERMRRRRAEEAA